MDYLNDITPEENRMWANASIFLSNLIINSQLEDSKAKEEAVNNSILAMAMIPPMFYAKC
jgi:hypothetical protein